MSFEPQRKIFVPMKSGNIQKIIERKKWTTLRTFPDARDIGLDVGESAYVMFGGHEFVITNVGAKTVEEAGGKEAVWKSEGFDDDGPGFPHVERWIEGYQRLYLYTIYTEPEWQHIKQSIQMLIASEQRIF